MRLTKYYIARRRRDDWIEVSFAPRLVLYALDREGFFRARDEAYDKLAWLLPPDAKGVISRSVWLRYPAEEGWETREVPLRWWQRLVLVSWYLMNTENWGREPGKSWWAIGRDTITEARMTRERFVDWRRGKEGANAVSHHGLGRTP